MHTFTVWTPALEVIAALPPTLGYHPEESVVLATLDLLPTGLMLGPNARVDLDTLELHPEVVSMAAERLWETGHHVLGAFCWSTARDPRDLARMVCQVEEFPGSADVLGTFVVDEAWIHGFDSYGHPRGRRDRLELGLTAFSMRHGAVELPSSQRALTPVRRPALASLPSGADLEHGWHLLTSASWDPARTLDVGECGLVAACLADPEFRDAFLSWALAGGPPVVSVHEVPIGEWLADSSHVAPSDVAADAAGILRRVAEPLPEGTAAPSLGTAAYLAWWCGDGLRARLLSEAALREDPSYPLAQLVDTALAGAVPPPWFHARHDAA